MAHSGRKPSVSFTSRSTAAGLFVLFVFSQMPVLAATTNAGNQAGGSSTPASFATPINLDLSSTKPEYSATRLVATKPLNINVGGVNQALATTSVLTPAELVAALQVFKQGTQTLQLGALGNATGGSFSLGGRLAQSVSNLVIPVSVSLIENFGKTTVLNLSGNLTNAGNLIGYSSNPLVTGAVINANNIFNQSGALLSTRLSNLPAGLTSATASLHLSLNAISSIVNSGTIGSSGNLNLSAANLSNYGNINSAGSMALNTAGSLQNFSAGQIVAKQALNINTSSLVNAGLMTSLASNLSIQNSSSQSPLSVLNTSGTIQALNGTLSLSSASGINLDGGDLAAQAVSLSAPTGAVNVNVGSLAGPVTVTADTVSMIAQGPLNIAALNATGDPFFEGAGLTFGNTGLSDTTPFTALSSTSITLSGALSAGDIFLIAGVTPLDAVNQTSISAPSNAPGSDINTNGNSITGTNINLAAFGNITATGPISAGSGTVNIYGSGNAQVGNITGAVVDIRSAVPNVVGLNFNNNPVTGGQLLAGTFAAGAPSAGSISQSPGTTITGTTSVNLVSGTGNIGLNSGSAINVNTPALTANTGGSGNVFLTSTGPVSLGTSSAGNIFQLLSAGNISTTGPLTANTVTLETSAGNANIVLGDDIIASGTVTLTTNGSGSVSNNLAVSSTLSLSFAPVAVGFDPLNGDLYVLNRDGGSVSVVNPSTGAIVATVSVGAAPSGIVVNNTGQFLYVTNTGSNSVSIIDAGNNNSVSTVPLPGFTGVSGLAISPDGKSVYVADSLNHIAVIDTSNNNSVSTVVTQPTLVPSAGVNFRELAVDPSNHYLFVAGQIEQTVYVYDITNNFNLVTTVPSGGNLIGAAANQGVVSITTILPDFVIAINIASQSVIKAIPIGGVPSVAPSGFEVNGITVNPAGTYAYVSSVPDTSFANFNTGNTVSVINLTNNQVVGTIPVQSYPLGMAINPAGDRLFVADSGSNSISVIKLPLLSASTINLNSSSGSFAGLQTSATNLSVNTGGSASVGNSRVLTLQQSSVGGDLTIGAAGTISVVGSLSAANLTLGSLNTNSNISLQNNLTGIDSVTLSTFGSGNVLQTAGSIGGGVLTLQSDFGDFGSNSNALQTSVATLFANTGGNTALGNVFINQSGALDIENSTVGNTFQIKSTGVITVNAPISADKILLQTTANNTDIILAANVNGTTSVNVIATGKVQETSNTVSSYGILANISDANFVTPSGIAFYPGGNVVYVTDSGADKLFVINTTTNQVIDSATVSLPASPTAVAINPAGTRAYVILSNQTMAVVKIRRFKVKQGQIAC